MDGASPVLDRSPTTSDLGNIMFHPALDNPRVIRPVFIRALALVPVLAALIASPARAQDKPDSKTVERARDYFAAGSEAYGDGQYLVAITAFEEAYRLVPRPAIAFSLAQAHRLQYTVNPDPRHVAEAVRLYRLYLDEVSRGGRRNDAAQHLQALVPLHDDLEARGKIGDNTAGSAGRTAPAATQLMVQSKTPGARGSIDGSELSKMPVIGDVKPGTHKVRVEAPGHFAQETEATAVEGRLILVPVDLEPMPAKVSFKVPDGARIEIDGRAITGDRTEIKAGPHFVSIVKRGHRPVSREIDLELGENFTLEADLETTGQRKASYWVLGSAGVLLVATGVSTALTLSAQGEARDIENQIAGGQNITDAQRQAHNSAINDRNDFRIMSLILAGSAVAVATTGALLYWIDVPRIEAPQASDLTPERPNLVPVVTGNGVGAALIGRF